MKKLLTLNLLLAFAIWAPFARGQNGNVAIVDLDAVARELGVLEYIAVTLDNTRVEIDEQLKGLQSNLQAQMNETLQQVGDNPTTEQQQRIALTQRELNTQLNEARLEGGQRIEIRKLELIKEFRDALRPHALELAKEKGFGVVLNKVMPPVYAFDEGADITAELTEKARKAGLTRKAPKRIAPGGNRSNEEGE